MLPLPDLVKRCAIVFCLLALFNSSSFAQTSKVNDLQLKLKQNVPDTTRLKLLKQLAEAYTSVDPMKKLYYANVFKTLAEKLHDEQSIADASIQIGISYAQRGKLDTAVVLFQSAYDHSAKIKYLLGMGRAMSDLGFAHDRLGETKEAIRCDFESLVILKKTGNKKLINQLYTNIGSIYFDLQQYALAKSYFNQCLLSFTASKDTAGIGYALFTMGNCFQALRQDDTARVYFTKSLAIREKLGDINGTALVKRGLGQVNYHQKKYNEAIGYLNDALKAIRGLGDKYEECAALLDIIDVYVAVKDYPKAIDAGLLGLKLAKEIKSESATSQVLEKMVDVYKSKGDMANAFKYQSEYIKAEDDINTAKAIKDVTLVEFSRTRTENLALTKDNQLIASKNNDYVNRIKTYSSAIIITGIGLVFVLFFALMLYRSNHQKQEANKQLLLQKEEIAAINKELELLNEEIKTQVELTNSQNVELERVNDIKNKFFSIISHDLRAPIASLQSLMMIYREGSVNEDELALLLTKLEDTIITTGTFLDNLLEWSKSQMEGIVINKQNFDISGCIAENVKLFESKISMKNLLVINQANEPVIAHADRNMTNLVIRNLLSNSIKFCKPYDRITLSAGVHYDKVLIAVSDTGPGISEVEQGKLFDLEYAQSSGTQGEKGSHLGLILCRDMIKQNNGKIWFETGQDEGTIFWVELPAGV